MDSVAKKTAFDRWADAFGIDGERRDRLWSIMSQQALSPDDVNVYFLAASGVLEKVADIITASNDALPRQIEASAKRAVGPIAEAAGKSLELRLAEQSQHIDSGIKRSMAGFEAHAKRVIDGVGAQVAEIAEMRIGSAERADLMKGWAHVAGAVVLVALLGGAAFGWAMFNAGAATGRASVETAATGLAALATRPDASTILNYASHNDFNQATTAYCGSGAGSMLAVVEGSRRCGPFWYDAAPIVGQSATSPGALWNMLNAPLRGLDPLVAFLGGAVLIGFAGFIRSKLKRA